MTKPETKKFLDKAKDFNYIVENFLTDLEPLENRVSGNLVAQAKEYIDKCKLRQAKRAQLGDANGK